MDAQAQSRAPPGLEDRPRLVHGEDAFVAEHVAEPREPAPRDLRDDLVRDGANPFGAVGAELRRDLVRREQRRHETRQLRIPRGLGQDLERPDLVRHGQAVSGFRLDGRRAVRGHAREALAQEARELFRRGRARRADRGVDASAVGGDRRVALAGEPPPDLRAAVSGPDGMRVGVHEARQDGAARGVDRDLGRMPGIAAAVVRLGSPRRR